MSRKSDVCPHGMGGTLCHKCFPEHHTFLAVLPEKKYKTFVHGGFASEAVAKAQRFGAVEVYQRIYPNKKPAEPEDKEPVEDTV